MPQLTWIGKDKVKNHHHDIPFHLLKKEYDFKADNGKPENSQNNLLIQGDNLLALKSLLPKYEEKINCIYIDPPYNTSNEKWVYNDNVNDPHIKKWLGEVVGKEGEDLSRHDKWLCMMYPRLKLLHRLLNKNGVIFISIDDNEFANLKLICDEIFGYGNLVKNFIWHTDGHTDNQDKITHVHEYILCYAKNKDNLIYTNIVDPNINKNSKILNNFAENSITKNGIKNPPSEIYLPKGFPCESEFLFKESHKNINNFLKDVSNEKFITRELTKKYDISYPVRLDDMKVSNYCLISPCRVFSGWMNNDKLKKFIDNGFIPITEKDGSKLKFYLSKNGVIYYRREGRAINYIQTILEQIGTTEKNKYMLESMDIKFDYPKPITMIEFILSIFSQNESIILDSFMGSSTTAHAVLNLNAKDGGNRQFIGIEMMDYAETITAERIRKVINGYGSKPETQKGTGGGFSFYTIGETLFDSDGNLNNQADLQSIREYIAHSEKLETVFNHNQETSGYFLGKNYHTAYVFYYEPDQITTLSLEFLRYLNADFLSEKPQDYIIYADKCTLSDEQLAQFKIRFKRIPRDISKL
ncbi:site-specific DNA-methyltransferase [Aggregatibacter actinomycetemcomitans]|uniref:site-specific DNA-methyltransferase n=1 Tax=Aggregatibacter actinomycetemcomitans TaxID=714 RepID=UPI0011DD2FE5|nr:site-specific DNA-methyltransferase [Aggregatibacter actinomycetemcomitans]QEH44247.1 site-specific DNA-methyltransferase [Aggregatibacter actinomycetemcomitans]